MAIQSLKRSDFTETYAVHAGLRAAMKSKLFVGDSETTKAAEKLLRYLESEKSIYGRQCKMIKLMQKGGTITQLRAGLNCSRRTIFRYFLELEAANVDIELKGAKYHVSSGLLKLVS